MSKKMAAARVGKGDGTKQKEDAGLDSPDAKGFMSRVIRGLVGRQLKVEDVEDDAEKFTEAYKRSPSTISKKEMLSDVYKMDYPRRGKAVIINNKNFSKEMEGKGYKTRTGTDIDATKVGTRLKMLGFEVIRVHDVTCDEIKHLLNELSKEDHSDADAFVCIMLSHGEKDTIFGTDGSVDLKSIFEYFKGNNCPSLAGKPKLFFIQACRGTQFDSGSHLAINVTDANRDQDMFAFPQQTEIRIPNEADFLIAYSTVPGYYSWRNSTNGSWFMQALCRKLDECGTTMEFMKLMTRVNRLVAYHFISNTGQKQPDMHAKKQVPCITSMLTKDLYFFPKK